MSTRKPRTRTDEISWSALYRFLEPDPSKRAQESHMDELVMNVFRKLEWYFIGQGFADPEDLAQRTILRVARKCGAVVDEYVGDRTLYFRAFAKYVAKEEWKKRGQEDKRRLPMPEADPWEEKEAADECLTRCVEKLQSKTTASDDIETEHRGTGDPPATRGHWIIDYYEGEGASRIRRRRELSQMLGRDLRNLRKAASRVRRKLEDCVARCMGDWDRFEGASG